MRKCPKGHFMVKMRGRPPTYRGNPLCDICRTENLNLKPYFYHCALCKFDKCNNCSTDCPEHHGLKGFYTPIDGFGCDACGEVYEADSVMFGCRKCNYDLCANCVMNDCPKNHGLAEFEVPRSSFSCDGCKKKMPIGSTLYGCRACNYDLCDDCIFPC